MTTVADRPEADPNGRRGASFVRSTNPLLFVAFVLSIAVMSISVPGMWPFVAAYAVYVAVAHVAGVGRRYTAIFAKLFAVVGPILFVLRAIFLDIGPRLAHFGPFTVSVGGIADAAEVTLLVMSLCGAFVLVYTTLAAERVMLALEALGVTPRATYVLLETFQVIEDFHTSMGKVMEAQRARGIEVTGSLIHRMAAFIPILIPVFLKSLELADERAMALEVRGFNNPGEHSSLRTLPRTPVASLVVTLLTVLAALLSIVGAIAIWR